MTFIIRIINIKKTYKIITLELKTKEELKIY
jgi:hypothetical protein